MTLIWEVLTFILKRGTNKITYIIIASIDVWQSGFAHTFYAVFSQIHFCQNLRTFLGKIVLNQTLLV